MLHIYPFVLEVIARLRPVIVLIERKDRDLRRAARARPPQLASRLLPLVLASLGALNRREKPRPLGATDFGLRRGIGSRGACPPPAARSRRFAAWDWFQGGVPAPRSSLRDCSPWYSLRSVP